MRHLSRQHAALFSVYPPPHPPKRGVSCSGFRAQGVAFLVEGLGFRVQGILGLKLRVSRVSGSVFGADSKQVSTAEVLSNRAAGPQSGCRSSYSSTLICTSGRRNPTTARGMDKAICSHVEGLWFLREVQKPERTSCGSRARKCSPSARGGCSAPRTPRSPATLFPYYSQAHT